MPIPIYWQNAETFEPWDYRNPDTQGIGGSETCVIELAWRMARRGYPVDVFGPIPDDCKPLWRGTRWRYYRDNESHPSQPGLHVFSRCPAVSDAYHYNPMQRLWLVCQDMFYDDPKTGLTPERAARFERIIALCVNQAEMVKAKYPYARNKIVVSTNGLKCDLIREVEREGIQRDPHKLVYASSPDRGLLPLLKIFRRAREWVPDLKLEIAYGFDNIDKIPSGPMAAFKKECLKEADQPGVTWLGRIPQRELMRKMFSSGMWCYPFNARVETSCVQALEQQACGAVPIVSAVDAVAENVMHGTQIDGDITDPLILARFVQEIIRWSDPKAQEAVRPALMHDARMRFNWERVCDQWEHWIAGKNGPYPVAQYAFQHRHAKGRILNVGCGSDSSGLALRGAINLDIADRHPDGSAHQAHMLADARELPTAFHGRFDTVILGDILEHLTEGDRHRVLTCARQCLNSEGRVVVTWPVDSRPASEQHVSGEYAPGLPVPHPGAVSLEDMRQAWSFAGLTEEASYPVDYTFVQGWGSVLR